MFIVRAANRSDVPAMSRVQVETKRSCYLGFYPPELLMKLSKEKTALHWRRNLFDAPEHTDHFALVAEAESREVVGTLIAGPVRDADPQYTAEIYVLYVLPDFQHQGVGRALIKRAAQRLRDEGHDHLLIWALEANPACRFYEALGGAAVRNRVVDYYGYQLSETGYSWEVIEQLASMEDRIDAD